MDWLMGLLDRLFHRQPVPPPTPPPTPMPTPDNPATKENLVAAINYERTSRNRAPFDNPPKANQLAQDWADWMALHQTMTHGNFSARITHAYPNTAGGEDIAAGQQTVEEVVRVWMNSPPHRANILGNFDTLGVGFATGKNNVIYWCLDFARLHG